jgi:hypothetical protein
MTCTVSAASVVRRLRASGWSLSLADGHVVLLSPRGLPPHEINAGIAFVRDAHDEVASVLRAEAAAIACIRIPDLDRVVEVRVPWSATSHYFVPGDEETARLIAEGVPREHIWSSSELAALLDAGARPNDLQAIAEVRIAPVRDALLREAEAIKREWHDGNREWRTREAQAIREERKRERELREAAREARMEAIKRKGEPGILEWRMRQARALREEREGRRQREAEGRQRAAEWKAKAEGQKGAGDLSLCRRCGEPFDTEAERNLHEQHSHGNESPWGVTDGLDLSDRVGHCPTEE